MGKIPAQEARTILKMSQEDFLSFLRGGKLRAYKRDIDAPVDVEEIIENKRHAALKRQLWDSPAMLKLRSYAKPGWASDPYNEDFGGGVGRAMFRNAFGLDHSGVPGRDEQMDNEILQDLLIEQADLEAIYVPPEGERPIWGYAKIAKHMGGVTIQTVKKHYRPQGAPIENVNGHMRAFPSCLDKWASDTGKK